MKASESHRSAQEEEAWDCTVCTFKNPKEAFKCQICQTQKGTSTRRPKLNNDVLSQQQLIAKTVTKGGEAHRKARYGGGRKREQNNNFPPQLNNVDRSQPMVFEVFAKGFSVVITEFRPKAVGSYNSESPSTSTGSFLHSINLQQYSPHLPKNEAPSQNSDTSLSSEDFPYRPDSSAPANCVGDPNAGAASQESFCSDSSAHSSFSSGSSVSGRRTTWSKRRKRPRRQLTDSSKTKRSESATSKSQKRNRLSDSRTSPVPSATIVEKAGQKSPLKISLRISPPGNHESTRNTLSMTDSAGASALEIFPN